MHPSGFFLFVCFPPTFIAFSFVLDLSSYFSLAVPHIFPLVPFVLFFWLRDFGFSRLLLFFFLLFCLLPFIPLSCQLCISIFFCSLFLLYLFLSLFSRHFYHYCSSPLSSSNLSSYSLLHLSLHSLIITIHLHIHLLFLSFYLSYSCLPAFFILQFFLFFILLFLFTILLFFPPRSNHSFHPYITPLFMFVLAALLPFFLLLVFHPILFPFLFLLLFLLLFVVVLFLLF